MQLLINEHADVNLQNSVGMHDTALIWAAKKGHNDAIKLLLKAGAKINMPDAYGGTAIKAAIDQNHPEAVQILIDAGANIDPELDQQISHASTPLMSAVFNAESSGIYGDPEARILKIVLAAGASVNVNRKDRRGYTAIAEAVIRNKPEAVRLLLKAGADVNLKYSENNTALIYALNQENAEIVQLLLAAGAEVPAANTLLPEQNVMIKTVLKTLVEAYEAEFLAAAAAGDIAKIDKLMEQPLRNFKEVVNHEKLMSLALLALVDSETDISAAEFERVLVKLLAHGANINYQDLVEVGGAIEAKGAGDVAQSVKKHRIALDFAILQNRPDRVEFLLSKDADPLKLSEDAQAYLANFTLSKVTEFERAQERVEIKQRAKAAGWSEEDIISGINIAALIEAEVAKLADSKAFVEMAAGGAGAGGFGGGSGGSVGSDSGRG